MLKAAEDGSDYALSMGAIYESQRNMKIIENGFAGYETTDFFTSGYSAVEIYQNIRSGSA